MLRSRDRAVRFVSRLIVTTAVDFLLGYVETNASTISARGNDDFFLLRSKRFSRSMRSKDLSDMRRQDVSDLVREKVTARNKMSLHSAARVRILSDYSLSLPPFAFQRISDKKIKKKEDKHFQTVIFFFSFSFSRVKRNFDTFSSRIKLERQVVHLSRQALL